MRHIKSSSAQTDTMYPSICLFKRRNIWPFGLDLYTPCRHTQICPCGRMTTAPQVPRVPQRRCRRLSPPRSILPHQRQSLQTRQAESHGNRTPMTARSVRKVYSILLMFHRSSESWSSSYPFIHACNTCLASWTVLKSIPSRDIYISCMRASSCPFTFRWAESFHRDQRASSCGAIWRASTYRAWPRPTLPYVERGSSSARPSSRRWMTSRPRMAPWWSHSRTALWWGGRCRPKGSDWWGKICQYDGTWSVTWVLEERLRMSHRNMIQAGQTIIDFQASGARLPLSYHMCGHSATLFYFRMTIWILQLLTLPLFLRYISGCRNLLCHLFYATIHYFALQTVYTGIYLLCYVLFVVYGCSSVSVFIMHEMFSFYILWFLDLAYRKGIQNVFNYSLFK